MSDESDAKILNDVQERFDVNITELPDEIDLASYSKFLKIIIFYQILLLGFLFLLISEHLITFPPIISVIYYLYLANINVIEIIINY